MRELRETIAMQSNTKALVNNQGLDDFARNFRLSSKRVKEGNQVLLLLLGQVHLEALIVEIDEFV
jgi:hypothetical protein